MDSDRCVALHNAILEHGWLESGRTAETFATSTRTWWEVHGDSEEVERLHPSLRAFLQGARIVPRDCQPETSLFCNVHGLHHPGSLFSGPGSSMFEDPDMTLTLYATHEKLAGTPDGMLYEQLNHSATMHFDVEDDMVEDFSKWEKLESILIVWIEMIQKGNVVALPADVGKADWERGSDGGFRLVEGPQRDPHTEARRIYEETSPWTVQPWCLRDLEETLTTWQLAVEAIERKMNLDDTNRPHLGLYETATLDAAQIPEGFARKFLSKARRPRFDNIAPGLRISSPLEFTDQPFIDLQSTSGDALSVDEVPPILFFRNDARVISQELGFQYPYSGPHALVEDCQAGLWLDRCDRMFHTPFEDGCRLVLPIDFGSGHAKQSDLTPVDRCDQLMQRGINPYNEWHPVQLQAFLELVIRNLAQDHWTVDTHGVAGSADVWRDADTEERWRSYFVPMGPGKFW